MIDCCSSRVVPLIGAGTPPVVGASGVVEAVNASYWTLEIAFQAPMFQSHTPMRYCWVLEYMAGELLVNCCCSPVPNSMRMRGAGVEAMAATITRVVIGAPLGAE